MTGMTDISRHGADKSNRDGMDIKVRDDALIDPELLGATTESMMQAVDLVDDSDDDDGYDLADSGPGMAAKVVQTATKCLFFPIIFLIAAVKSLKHAGPFFKSMFSPSGRLGHIVMLVGTYTGIAWCCRKIAAFGSSLAAKREARRLARQQADEEAALEREILAEENARLQSPQNTSAGNTLNNDASANGHRKATATVQFSQKKQESHTSSNAQTSTEANDQGNWEGDPESQKTPRFGKLSRFAGAFRRSDPAGSSDTASDDTLTISSASSDPLVDHNDDPFESSGGRWDAKKKTIFAAACLVLLIGGYGVAKQVMNKGGDKDVAANTKEESQPDNPKPPKSGLTMTGTQSPNTASQNIPNFGGYGQGQPAPNAVSTRSWNQPQIPQTPAFNDNIDSNASMQIPPAPSYDDGTQNGEIPSPPGGMFGNHAGFQESAMSLFAEDTGSSTAETTGGFGAGSQTAQSGSLRVEVEGDEPPVTSNDGLIAQNQLGGSNPAFEEIHVAGAPSGYNGEYDNTGSSNDYYAAGTSVSETLSSRGGGNNIGVGSFPETSPTAGSPGDGNNSYEGSVAAAETGATFALTSPNTGFNDNSAATGMTGGNFGNPTSNGLANQNEDFTLQGDTMSGGGFPLVAAAAIPPEEYVGPNGYPQNTSQNFEETAAPATFELSGTSPAIAAIQPSVASNEALYTAGGSQTESQQPGLAATPRIRAMEQQSSGASFNLTANDSATVPEAAAPLADVFNPSQSRGAAAVTPVVAATDGSSRTDFGSMATGSNETPLQNTFAQNEQPLTWTAAPDAQEERSFALTSPPAPVSEVGMGATPVSMQPNEARQPSATQSQAIQGHVMSNNAVPVNAAPSGMGQQPMPEGDIVAPSHHIATAPMLSPTMQAATNTASNLPLIAAQRDTGAASYAMQSQPVHVTQPQPVVLQLSPQQTAQQPQNVAANGQTYVYVVREGDDIFSIAKQELGRVRRYREIYELNRDRLPMGQNTLTAGMELLLPAN